jgi:hypothetical protein
VSVSRASCIRATEKRGHHSIVGLARRYEAVYEGLVLVQQRLVERIHTRKLNH